MYFRIDVQIGSKYTYGKFYQNELVLAKSMYSKISMLVQLSNYIYISFLTLFQLYFSSLWQKK